jgi:hypothetical protein
MPSEPKLSAIQTRILEVLKAHPEGISEGQMRAELNLPSHEMVQFGRRRRSLHSYFLIEKIKEGRETKYVLKGPRPDVKDSVAINQKLRAGAMRLAGRRCQMCGRTIQEHGISLVVDHKIPREWGGKTVEDNLWAICEECNAGKKDLFSSVDSPELRAAIVHKSPHVRIGELLKGAGIGEPIPSHIIQFVADQDQWDKRLRELRYLGWEIRATTRRKKGGRTQSFYTLLKWKPWPEDPSRWIQNYERERDRKNRAVKRKKLKKS